jgi:hypothetical protein
MNKRIFLDNLKTKLKDKGIQPTDIQEVLDDYESIIDEALSNGEDETLFIEGLGQPSKIIKSLKLRKTKLQRNKEKIIGISPFIAIIIFFLVGFLFDGFGYSWLAFLLIPILAIFLEEKGFERILGASAIIAVIIYYALGFWFSLWHPGWIVFTLLIPLALIGKKLKYRLFYATSLVILIGIYTYLESTNSQLINALLLLPLIPFAFITQFLHLEFSAIKVKIKEFAFFTTLIIILISIYLYLGLVLNAWHPGWVIFMLIPMVGLGYDQIIKKKKHPIVAYTPFVSVILFILIGEIFNAYAYSWLIFLLIPIMGVLSEKGEEKWNG